MVDTKKTISQEDYEEFRNLEMEIWKTPIRYEKELKAKHQETKSYNDKLNIGHHIYHERCLQFQKDQPTKYQKFLTLGKKWDALSPEERFELRTG